MAFDDLTDNPRRLAIRLNQKLASSEYEKEFRAIWHLAPRRWFFTLKRLDGEPVQLSTGFESTDLEELKELGYITKVQDTPISFRCSLTKKALDEYKSFGQAEDEREPLGITERVSLKGWSRGEKLALLALPFVIIACIAAVMVVPEARERFGLPPSGITLTPPSSTHTPTATSVPIDNPTPTPTPNRALRQDIREFFDRFWEAQLDAFKSGDLASMEGYFCEDRAFHEFPGLSGFESYKEHAQGLMDLELYPYEHDEPIIDEIPYSIGGQPTVWTTEHWFEGPCPSDGSGPEKPYRGTLTLAKLDSEWCITTAFVEIWHP